MFTANKAKLPPERRSAQSVVEYSIGVVVVVMAIVAMTVYVKRGISGRYADVVNATGKSAESGQYEPYYQKSGYNISANKTIEQKLLNNGEKIENFNETNIVGGNISSPIPE